ncbi:MAG: DUF1249 domain-containing protein [Methylococcaceae bacterium]|nr:MAG: DUF1249 domain-containing protein [Methylococcaceae bacterium]
MHTLLPANKSYWLQHVCETNYFKLLRLLPDLQGVEQAVLEGDKCGQPALHIRLLERTPYTVTVELSHVFAAGAVMEPAVQVRVFLDAKLAEVLSTAATPPARTALPKNPPAVAVLDYKWRLNYFLEKWLDHCLRHGYRMTEARGGVA